LLTRLESLHNIGYIHGDIKPDNIVVKEDKSFEKLSLIDFGLSQQFGKKANYSF